MKKKILKIVGGVFLVLVLLLIATPFFLKGKIAEPKKRLYALKLF